MGAANLLNTPNELTWLFEVNLMSLQASLVIFLVAVNNFIKELGLQHGNL